MNFLGTHDISTGKFRNRNHCLTFNHDFKSIVFKIRPAFIWIIGPFQSLKLFILRPLLGAVFKKSTMHPPKTLVKHVAVAGNIGAGKTTLSTRLARHFGWEVNYEDT